MTIPNASPERVGSGRGSMFRSLQYPNARRFFAGLAVSNIGTWLQFTATVFVVRRLGGSGLALGIVTACQFLPMLVLGLWAGALADRRDRRLLALFAQAGMAVQALTLGVLDLSGVLNLPTVYAMTLVLGLLSAIDNPARRGLATELVPSSDLTNVMSLNTSVMTGSRIFGPALAGLLVELTDTGWCFLLNGVSFAALLWSLVAIDTDALHRAPPAPSSATPIRDGLRAVWFDPVLRGTVVVFAVVSTFAFNYSVAFPLVISENLERPDSTLGPVLSVVSVGSVIGALIVARLTDVGQRFYLGSVALLGTTMAAMALVSSLPILLVLAVPFGAGASAFVSSSNAIMANRTSPEMRGRVLALGAVLFLGSTPIGGPLTGLVGDTFGATWSLLYGALITLFAALGGGWYVWVRRLADEAPVDPAVGLGAVRSPSGAANTPR